ncbi:30S ribosomal protein S8 [Candidatus Berkelbacteria bacterium CG_4_9_14_3_um_filter_39_23]|uniref:Small ribosomal subunit protein uS8 n=2 Tax=Candidatus Berkelbacteria TaxID=1618330 RepID=A0A2M7CJ80_9BACT|nr:30S ribosomal protein S8 [Candidatus Berkelbacteria bacterium]OIP06177.1 MAG: 30S ribosomal protein S8 [Candidatus Berkelbacteria bacterium CG2_30_39_44]PIR28099.1 MAG: 30S ribosomal protein S8 [Candidatus Berkelbacteria bacterium CG11_big_fil_rev_8_21_14_0_20_40_23]PIV25675.1 MAG: 30S ribosomal protein S8 [Candidatus Berkelbacteria bacterium CG03_land_8_20_14_0_80_40_36]PIX30719.1 MAG: 30S ribosomal protein S8 [Candidatus Berkelbacteria bacterium CG_4_8_14_3_um_filter_39_27]PIZ28895.1 MAG:
MVNDPIANLLNNLRNGYASRKIEIDIKKSRLLLNLLKVFKKYKYIEDFKLNENKKSISITLAYNEQDGAIHSVKQISKPSRRVYVNASKIPYPKNGRGIIIITTPEGLMAHYEAKKKHIGGELICEVE